jgi:iron complex transport system permease protein
MHSKQKRGRNLSTAAVLGIVLFFLFIASLMFSASYREWVFSPALIFESVQRRFGQLYLFFFGEGSPIGVTVYQYLAVALSGAGLAVCGAILQGSFRNVLAGPSTMGVMSGGSLGCMLYLIMFVPAGGEITNTVADLTAYANRSFFEIYGQQLFTFIGCIGGVALILAVATFAGRGKLSASAMIVSGTVFSSLTGNISMLIQYYLIKKDPYDVRIDAVKNLMMGSINGITSLKHVVLLAVPILVCIAMLLVISGRLNLLSLGEDEALTMGVDIRKLRYVLVAVTSVISAAVLAFCGHIGFLGFMVPLIGRKLVGPNMRVLLPNCMLLGAILLIVVFDIAYFFGLTDYLNLFTSGIGCVVMVVTLLNKKGGAADAAIQRRNSHNMG